MTIVKIVVNVHLVNALSESPATIIRKDVLSFSERLAAFVGIETGIFRFFLATYLYESRSSSSGKRPAWQSDHFIFPITEAFHLLL